MIKKLRFKLVLAAMLSLLAVLLLIIGGAGIFSYHRLVSEADSKLTLLAENGGKFPDNFDPRNLPDQKMPYRFSPELPYEARYFTVTLTEKGSVATVNTGKIAAVDTSDAMSYAEKISAKSSRSGFISDYRYFVYDTDDESSGKQIIFIDCGRELGAFRSFLLTSTLIALIGLAAVLVLLILSSERITRIFSESYEKQKRFITDAGHELKTPLTIIDADAQVLEMDFGENEWLDDIQSQTRRLAELTNNLIFLARMEEDHPQIEMIEFPLSDIAEETAQTFQALARTANRTLKVHIQPMLTLTGDEKAIRRLITIFLDNAIKYSDEGGLISLSLEKQKGSLRLSVFNTAEHVSRDSLKNLFDRFYRTDKSRNSRTGGYGLGLSIAAAIVRTHRGKIQAATDDEKSLRITVTFPV